MYYCINESDEKTVLLDAGCYWFWRRRRVLSVFCSFCFRRSSSSVLGDNLINKATNGIKCLSFCDFSILKMAHISWPWLKINYDSTHLPRTSPCLWSPMPTFVNWSFAWGNLLDHETASPHHLKEKQFLTMWKKILGKLKQYHVCHIPVIFHLVIFSSL